MAEFTNTLVSLNRGQVETELSLRLKDVVAAVRDTGKTGKLTFTLEVAKDKNDERLIRLSTDLKVKIPEPSRPANHFYIRDNRLISLDDAQMRLDLGPGSNPEPKTIELPESRVIEHKD